MAESTTENERIEVLRQILAKEQERDVSYEEAYEVGESLLCFFQALGGAVTG